MKLVEAERRLGAVMGRPAGEAAEVARSYGSPAEEYRSIRRGCALGAARPVDELELAGADRLRFLNGLVTCEVRDLEPGAGRFGLLTDGRGRVLADAVLQAAGEALRLELPPGRGEAVAEHLLKYRVADRVEVAPPAAAGERLWLAGPDAAGWLAGRIAPAAPPAAAWAWIEAELEGAAVRIQRRGEPGEEAFSLRLPAAAAAALLEAAAAAGAGQPSPVGRDALDAVRIERGLPLWGLDYGDDAFPQETGRDDGLSFEKGCYLGQEVVARIHYRGKVNRALRALVYPEGAPTPDPGAALDHEGREAGRAGTTVLSPRLGRPVGLALVHRRAADPGTRVTAAGAGEAEVAALPLTP